MPFQKYKQFDTGAMQVMTAAYDAVIAKLGIPSSDPRTSWIAAKIVALASEGEADVDTLCVKTCAEFRHTMGGGGA
jgi:hypothetical protein